MTPGLVALLNSLPGTDRCISLTLPDASSRTLDLNVTCCVGDAQIAASQKVSLNELADAQFDVLLMATHRAVETLKQLVR